MHFEKFKNSEKNVKNIILSFTGFRFLGILNAIKCLKIRIYLIEVEITVGASLLLTLSSKHWQLSSIIFNMTFNTLAGSTYLQQNLYLKKLRFDNGRVVYT